MTFLPVQAVQGCPDKRPRHTKSFSRSSTSPRHFDLSRTCKSLQGKQTRWSTEIRRSWSWSSSSELGSG